MNLYPMLAPLGLICLFALSCQRPFLADDDVVSKANWDAIEVGSERLILGLHATPFEWYAISENEFFRFDSDNKLLEKRPLQRNAGVLGVPVLSDNTFVRITTNDDAKQVIEFHLARNPSEIHSILTEGLKAPSDNFMEVETLGTNNLGAFSPDGTLLMLPATVLPDLHYALLIFQIQHNTAHSSFSSVEMVKRVNLEDLSSDLNKLKSIRFIDGNFYVTSQEGAWRITPSGNKEKIFTQWMIDAFPWKGDSYMTGLNPYDLHKSEDNGLNWKSLDQNSELKIVTNANELLFTQSAPSLVYQLMDAGLMKAKDIILPNGHSPQEAIYYGVMFFKGKYYFSMDRDVYTTTEIVVE